MELTHPSAPLSRSEIEDAGKQSESDIEIVGMTSGFILSTQTVVLHNNKAPSNFFMAVGDPCKIIYPFRRKCSPGDVSRIRIIVRNRVHIILSKNLVRHVSRALALYVRSKARPDPKMHR